MIQINKINEPFLYYCQKVIPLAFDESMSYYEMLCNLTAKIKEVIDEQNNQGEGIIELQNKYIELKDYVDHYFDNLDVQEEINNKLDEMAEQGQLTDIIAQYLGLAGVLAFNTLDDLENAENVTNGSICLILGKDTYNDGKTTYYKIRTILNTDVIDGDNIIAIINDNTLVGEKIINIVDRDPINVKLHGAKGDGVTDDTEIIQSLIDNNPNKTLYFPEGTYLVSEPILTPANYLKSVYLKLDKYTIIKADSEFTGDYVIKLGGKDNNDQSMYNIGVLYGIEGGIIDCNNVCGGISVYGISPTVKNCEIRNCNGTGIDMPYGMHSGSTDALISDVNIFGNNSSDTVGIDCKSYDNTIENVSTFKTLIGVKVTAGGNYFRNIHPLYSNDDLTNYNNSIAFYIKAWNNNFYNCYSDQFSTGFYIDGNYRNVFYSPIVYYYAGGNYNHTGFYCNGLFNCFIDNLFVEFKDNTGVNTVLKIVDKNFPEGNITNLHISNITTLTGSDESCYDPHFNYDRIKCANADITTSGTLSNNAITANNGSVNLGICVTGVTANQNSALNIITLPNGFKPKSNVNLLIYDTHANQFRKITSWINTNGQVYVNSTDSAIASSDVLFISGFYNIL